MLQLPAAQAFHSSAMPLPPSYFLWYLLKLPPASFPLTLPGPDAGTEQLFLVLLLHGTHDFIAPHLSLPGRGVLGQLIIFHTQVIPQLWSSLLLPCSEPFLALLYKMHLSWRSQSCISYSAHGQWHNDVLCFALFSFLRQGYQELPPPPNHLVELRRNRLKRITSGLQQIYDPLWCETWMKSFKKHNRPS